MSEAGSAPMIEADIEDRRAVREPADGYEIDAGRRDRLASAPRLHQ